MSDNNDVFQRWEAPFFEQPATAEAQAPIAELEAIAQARGFQTGKEEGMETARADAKDIISRITAIADEMVQPFVGLDDLVAKELAQMAMLLAKQIVRRELSIDSGVITQVVDEALSTLYKLEGEIVVFLNPADAALIRELVPKILEGKSWKLVEDAGLFPGGCQVKTPTSFVDASIEKQMEEVFADLLESCEKQLEP